MKRSLIIIFVAIGILIGVFFTAHLKTNAPVGSLYPADLIAAREDLIKDYISEQALYQAQIASLHKDIEEVQKQNEGIINKAKLSDLENLKKKIGLTVIDGEGVEITLNDSESISRDISSPDDKKLIHASDLRDVINLLWANKAKAIAVNGQRILSTTPINAAGGSILVNNIYIVPPITIVSIVDPALIEARMYDKYALTDLKNRIWNKEIRFEMKSKKLINAPIYISDFKLKYLTASPNE